MPWPPDEAVRISASTIDLYISERFQDQFQRKDRPFLVEYACSAQPWASRRVSLQIEGRGGRDLLNNLLGNDDHGDMLPQELSKAISDFIARKYPGARIVDAEREKGNTEVDIIFAGKALEVCFGTGDAWLWTKTGVRLSEVPDVVRRTLQSSQYGTWGIDDVDLYESPDRVWYAIEVEDPQSEREATVRILEDGTLL